MTGIRNRQKRSVGLSTKRFGERVRSDMIMQARIRTCGSGRMRESVNRSG